MSNTHNDDEASPGDTESMKRDRGILTTVDRRFLRGLKHYEGSIQTSERRRTIRNRIVDSVLDMTYLDDLPPSQREKVFDELSVTQLDASVNQLVTFAYLHLHREMGAEEGRKRLESIISRGVWRALQQIETSDPVARVDVEIEPEYEQETEVLYAEFKKGRELTDEQVGRLIRSAELDKSEIAEFGEKYAGN